MLKELINNLAKKEPPKTIHDTSLINNFENLSEHSSYIYISRCLKEGILLNEPPFLDDRKIENLINEIQF